MVVRNATNKHDMWLKISIQQSKNMIEHQRYLPSCHTVGAAFKAWLLHPHMCMEPATCGNTSICTILKGTVMQHYMAIL
jgi:hypothetical protein